MISDSDKNFVWLSAKLQSYESFYLRLKTGFEKHAVKWDVLHFTNDIWARDYMPVQVRKDKFVQFNYDPNYLKPKRYRHLRTDQDKVCQQLPYPIIKSSLIVDGGNIVNSKNAVIMCEKVFEENKNLSKKQLIGQLRDLLETDKIIFLPWDKRDYTGHADGMVKYIDEKTVFINRYPKKEVAFGNSIKKIIASAGLDFIELPYNLSSNSNNDSAVGIYINYLQIKDVVFMPVFGLPEDEEAYDILSRHLSEVVTVPSNDIAREGGVLNCISWNVKCCLKTFLLLVDTCP